MTRHGRQLASARARSRRPARATRPPARAAASAAASRAGARRPRPRTGPTTRPTRTPPRRSAPRPSRRQAPRRRTSSDAEWVAGRNSVVEVLRAGVPVTASTSPRAPSATAGCARRSSSPPSRACSLLEVTRNELDRMTGGAVHQGLAARLPAYEYAHADDLLDRADEAEEPALIVALDSVTDPRNLGAVVRSAAGFGAHGVLIPERRAAGMTASAWKTSAGAAARIPVAQTVNLIRQLKAYQEAGCMVVGLAADGDVSLPELRPRRARRRPAGRGRRLRGQGPGPPGRRDLRPARLDPDGQPAGVAQRRRRRLGRPLRRSRRPAWDELHPGRRRVPG